MCTQHQSYRRIPTADAKGRTALMVELCKKHLSRFPNDRFAMIWYAMAKIQFHQYAEAEKLLRHVITLSKGDGRLIRLASIEMGHLFLEKGYFKKATLWYQRGIQSDPKYGDGYNFLGLVASKGGKLDQAETFYRKAIECPARSIDESYFNLGGVLMAKRLYKEAINCYSKAIAIDPKYTIAKKRLKDAQLALQMKNT